MNAAYGKSKRNGRAAGEGEAGEETAERIGTKLVVLFVRYDGEDCVAVGEGCWGHTSTGSENGIHRGSTKVGKAEVAVHGGGCEEVWKRWVRGCNS